MNKALALCIALASSWAGGAEKNEADWEVLSQKLKPMVVNIEYIRPIGLSRDEGEHNSASGFVIDPDEGIVVTNQHVVGESPLSSISVIFSNQQAIDAKLLYYDPWHDFAFLKYDPKALKTKPPKAVLGNYSELKEGEPVMLIGNASSQGFSMKIGQINRLRVVKHEDYLGRHSHQIHLSLARAGGTSGSPVFNRRGEVIGVHTSGRENESFELRIDYVARAYEYCKEGKTPPRGDLLLSLVGMPARRAQKYLGYKPLSEQEFALAVDLLLPGSSAAEKLKPADIVMAVRGKNEKDPKAIGDDVFLFDHIVDENVGGNVELTVVRDGKVVSVNLPVEDAEKGKVKKFVTFAGSTFHDVTASIGLQFSVPRDGVFMSESDSGGTFEMGKLVRDTAKKRRVIVKKIGSTAIRTIDDFIRYASKLKKGDARTVWVSNLTEADIRADWYYADIDPTFGELKSFTWDDKAHVWDEN